MAGQNQTKPAAQFQLCLPLRVGLCTARYRFLVEYWPTEADLLPELSQADLEYLADLVEKEMPAIAALLHHSVYGTFRRKVEKRGSRS